MYIIIQWSLSFSNPSDGSLSRLRRWCISNHQWNTRSRWTYSPNPCSPLASSLRRTPDNLPGQSTSPVLQDEVFIKWNRYIIIQVLGVSIVNTLMYIQSNESILSSCWMLASERYALEIPRGLPAILMGALSWSFACGYRGFGAKPWG